MAGAFKSKGSGSRRFSSAFDQLLVPPPQEAQAGGALRNWVGSNTGIARLITVG